MRYKKWIQCKLDKSFGNKEWFNMFHVANQSFLEKRGSDHRPVLVKMLDFQETYRGQFRFDKRMLHKPLVIESILGAWNNIRLLDVGSVSDMIRLCRKTLSKWKKYNNMNSKDKIEQIQKYLEEEQSLMQPNRFRINRVKFELLKAYKEEKTFWN